MPRSVKSLFSATRSAKLSLHPFYTDAAMLHYYLDDAVKFGFVNPTAEKIEELGMKRSQFSTLETVIRDEQIAKGIRQKWKRDAHHALKAPFLQAEFPGIAYSIEEVQLSSLITPQAHRHSPPLVSVPKYSVHIAGNRIFPILFPRPTFLAIAKTAEVTINTGLPSHSRMDQHSEMPVPCSYSPPSSKYNYCTFIEFRGRWFIYNGVHRVCAFAESGWTSVPALVLRPKSIEQYFNLMSQVRLSSDISEQLLTMVRPPLAIDFLDHSKVVELFVAPTGANYIDLTRVEFISNHSLAQFQITSPR